MIRANQSQWEEFCKTTVWGDLKEFLEDCIELNRDLLEGTLEQAQEVKETEEALRGRNRMARELIQNIEGWANGSVPISE